MNEALIYHIERVLHQEPSRGTPPHDMNPDVKAAVGKFLTAREELRETLEAHLDSAFLEEASRVEEPCEWQDDELDAAIERFRFWHTWGN